MTYAIIGTGSVGVTLARFFAAKDIPVLIANSRGPDTLGDLTAELGASVEAVTSPKLSKPTSSSSRSDRSPSRISARCCRTGRARSSST